MAFINKTVAIKTTMLIAVITFIGISIYHFSMGYLNSPSRLKMLFKGLRRDKTIEIISKLKEMNITYELDDSGQAISVPSKYISFLRDKFKDQELFYAKDIEVNGIRSDFSGQAGWASKNKKHGHLNSSEMHIARNRIEIQRAIDEYLAEKAQALIDRALGSGRSIVKVSVVLDFDQIEKTVEKLDPQNVVKTEKISQESFRDKRDIGQGHDEAGERPVSDIIDQIEGRSHASGNHDGMREVSQYSFEIGRTSEHTIRKMGGIQRLSVAVLVQQRTLRDKRGEAIEVPSARELRAYESLIKQAVGYDPVRQDQFSLCAVPYETYRMFVEEEKIMFASELRDITKHRTLRALMMCATLIIITCLVFWGLAKMSQSSELDLSLLHASAGADSAAESTPKIWQRLIRMSRDDPKAVAKEIESFLDEKELS